MFLLQSSSDIDGNLQDIRQPQIVAVGELFDVEAMYIVCEGGITCTITQNKINDAILAMLASYYIFNIHCKNGSNVLSFLERALLGVSSGKPRLCVRAYFNTLANV